MVENNPAPAKKQLWDIDYGYHIIGPGDIHGPYTKEKAFYEANEINKAYADDIIKNGFEAITCLAIVKRWEDLL